MTRLRAERPRFRAWFRSGTKNSSLHAMSKLAYGPMQPRTLWVLRAYLMRVKRPGCAAELLRPIVEVKKAWSYISAPPYIFMNWCFFRHTGNFTNIFIVWRRRSPNWRLSFVSSYLISPSVGLCYIARKNCSDILYTHQFYRVVYWVGSESVVFAKFWIICLSTQIGLQKSIFAVSYDFSLLDLNDSYGS